MIPQRACAHCGGPISHVRSQVALYCRRRCRLDAEKGRYRAARAAAGDPIRPWGGNREGSGRKPGVSHA